MVHGGANSGVGAFTAHGIVGDCIDTVERDLNVDVVHRRQTLGGFGGDATTVGRELHADAFFDAVLDDLEEVGAQHWFATTDVDVEHLHLGELVDNGLHLLGGEFVGIATTGGRKAVHALQIACVGPLPRETDGRVESLGELFSERGHVVSSYAAVSRTRKSPAASEVSAFSNDGQRLASRPAASNAARAEGWSFSDSTSVTKSGERKNVSRRLP